MAAGEADLIIVESVMGLFGRQHRSADLASVFSLPVVAVIDAWATAPTFGAIALGRQRYQTVYALVWRPGRTHGRLRACRDVAAQPAEYRGLACALPNDPRISAQGWHLALVPARPRSNPIVEKPALADCGAMMCLFDLLETDDGTPRRMWGIFSSPVMMQT